MSNIVLVDKWQWICWDNEFGRHYLDKYFRSEEEVKGDPDVLEKAKRTQITVKEREKCD